MSFKKGDKIKNTLTGWWGVVVNTGKDEDGDYIHVRSADGTVLVFGESDVSHIRKIDPVTGKFSSRLDSIALAAVRRELAGDSAKDFLPGVETLELSKDPRDPRIWIGVIFDKNGKDIAQFDGKTAQDVVRQAKAAAFSRGNELKVL